MVHTEESAINAQFLRGDREFNPLLQGLTGSWDQGAWDTGPVAEGKEADPFVVHARHNAGGCLLIPQEAPFVV